MTQLIDICRLWTLWPLRLSNPLSQLIFGSLDNSVTTAQPNIAREIEGMKVALSSQVVYTR